VVVCNDTGWYGRYDATDGAAAEGYDPADGNVCCIEDTGPGNGWGGGMVDGMELPWNGTEDGAIGRPVIPDEPVIPDGWK